MFTKAISSRDLGMPCAGPRSKSAGPRLAIPDAGIEIWDRKCEPRTPTPDSGDRHWEKGNYSSLIGMVVPFAEGVLGSLTVSRPFLKVAFTFSASTDTGSLMLRAKAPYERSIR